MKRKWIPLLCLLLLLSGCGKAERSQLVQERYAAVTSAEMTAEITCHLPAESRTFQIHCDYRRDGRSEITVLEPEELSGLKAVVSEEDLSLSYDGLVLPAGTQASVSAANCLPWLMRAAAGGYVLEEGRESLEGTPCLRAAFDTTGDDGQKVLCTIWFDESTLTPVYGELSREGELILTVRMIQFSAELEEPAA